MGITHSRQGFPMRDRARRTKPSFCPGKQPPCEHSLSEHRGHSALLPLHTPQPLPVSSRAPHSPARLCRDAWGSAGAAADLFSNLWEISCKSCLSRRPDHNSGCCCPLWLLRTHQGSCCSSFCSLDLFPPWQSLNIPIYTP